LFCYTFQLKNGKKKKLPGHYLVDAGWQTNVPWFQDACPGCVQVESSSCCFPWEVVSFVHLRAFSTHDVFSSNQKTYFELGAGLKKSAVPLFQTGRFSFWTSNFSFFLARLARDQATCLTTKSLK